MMSFVQTGQINETIEKFKNPPNQKKKGCVYYKQIAKNPSGYNDYLLCYDTPEVPAWSEKETIDFITPRAVILNEAFEKKLLPPHCDEEMAKWKCKSYCIVKDICIGFKNKEQEKNDEN